VARTISATDVLERRADTAAIADAIVLIGAPRPSWRIAGHGDRSAHAFVQIQADAIEQIAAGRFPRQIGGGRGAQLFLAVMLGALALAASAMLPPILGALASSRPLC